MTLLEKIRNLPHRWRLRHVRSSTDLNEVARIGAEVTNVVVTPGYAAIDRELEAQERVLLERFVSDEVTSWEKFLELRGYVRGFMAKRSLPDELIAAGIKAEQALLQLDGK